tara:strand:- start:1589 stop:1804 length:216 start_codon:yes stop_codon:yes gene_type:complete
MRIIEIVTTDLASDRLKAEENLENLINSKEDTNIRVSNIKKELEKIVNIDNMINKWIKYISKDESNNNNNE